VRPQPPPEQDQSTTGIAGKYMVVKRLLPLFEQYAPTDITESMRSEFEALNSLVSESIRRAETDSVQKGSLLSSRLQIKKLPFSIRSSMPTLQTSVTSFITNWLHSHSKRMI
jgi:hypothetical protein